jgi:hypothetical protein
VLGERAWGGRKGQGGARAARREGSGTKAEARARMV